MINLTINPPSSIAVTPTNVGTVELTIGTGGITQLAQLSDINLTGLTDGQILEYDTTTGKWKNVNNSGGGGGASAFIDLTDVPASYTAQGGKYLKVNETADGVEFEVIEEADLPTGIDAAKIGNGTVSNTEFQTLNGAQQPFTTALKSQIEDAVLNADYNVAHSILVQQSGTGTPTTLQVPSNSIVGNDSTGDIIAMTATQVRTLINVENGADVTDAGNVGSSINGATEQTVITNTDRFALFDGVLKWSSWTTIKATLKTYLDTLYQVAGTYLTSANITQVITNGVTDKAPSEDAVFDALAGKQATLVSGTNIKTINGTTLLGSGDITVSGGGVTNWTEAYNSATQATSSFAAIGAGANINAAILPKGTGGIIASIPDGTTTGGNARGTYTVDLQTIRSSAAQVSAGAYSVLGGGQDNHVIGQWGYIGGGYSNYATSNGGAISAGYNNTNASNYGYLGGGTNNNINSGVNAVLCGGENGYTNADYTFLGGGLDNRLNAAYTHISGGKEADATLYGQYAASAGQFAARADAQYSRVIMRRAITGTSATELFLDGSSTRAILPATNTIWNARVQIAATVSSVGNGTCTAGDTFIGEYVAGIKRLNTTTSLVGTVQAAITAQADTNMSSAVVTITADDTNEALKVEFTPPSTAGTTTVIRVVATVQLTQIKY
jgi:hypothetical protein